jgi:hypothetical protein
MYGMGWDGDGDGDDQKLFMIINNSNSPAIGIAVADFQNPKLPFSEHPYFSVFLWFCLVPTTQRH